MMLLLPILKHLLRRGSMPKYRKNPVVIEAVQYDGTNEKEIELFVNKTIGV